MSPAEGEVVLDDVPFHPQEAFHCGPASLRSLLEASGVPAESEELAERVYVPGLEGSLQVEMQAAARSFGRIAYVLPPEPEAVLGEVAAGRPVLVLLNLRTPSVPRWHYAVVVGFDAAKNDMILHSGREAATRWGARPWLRRWDWAGRWALVLLEPGEWPVTVERGRMLEALAAFERTAEATEVERAWATATERWPTEAIAWLGLGNARYALDRPSEASEAFAEAIAVDPEHLPARINLATILSEAGRACEALEALGPAPAVEHPLAGRWADLEATVRRGCMAP